MAETPSSQKPAIPVPAWVEGMKKSAMDPTDDCRYYCPLCMMYFQCVYEAKCCGHTICDECAGGLLDVATMNLGDPAATATSSSGVQPDDEDGLIPEASFPLTPNCTSTKKLPLECPFCRNDGLSLKIIEAEAGEHLRNYEDSPMAARELTPSAGHCEACTPNGSLRAIRPSPLKVGDSFEKMMSKMVPLEGFQQQQANQNPPRPSSREGVPLPRSRPSSREALRPGSREAMRAGSRPSSREAVGSAAKPPLPPNGVRTPVPLVGTPGTAARVPQLDPAPVPNHEEASRDGVAPAEEVPHEQVLVVDESKQAVLEKTSSMDSRLENAAGGPHNSLPGMPNPDVSLVTPQRLITTQNATTPLGIEPMSMASNAIVA